jgi:hypothetical protein
MRRHVWEFSMAHAFKMSLMYKIFSTWHFIYKQIHICMWEYVYKERLVKGTYAMMNENKYETVVIQGAGICNG